MTGPAIQPTATHQVRAFLASQGAAVRPATGLDETYAELYGLLNARKDDPEFWPHVEALLKGLVGTALDPAAPRKLPAPDAELLAAWDIEGLVRDLQKALPGGAVPRDFAAVKRFASGLSTAVLGGFLALGLAASGCVMDTEPEPSGGDGGPYSDTGPEGDSGLECDTGGAAILRQTVEASERSEQAQERLCSCMASLNVSWKAGLAELFETGTAQDISRALSRLVDCCNSASSELDSSYTQNEGEFLNGTLCYTAQPVYKGVSFPRR